MNNYKNCFGYDATKIKISPQLCNNYSKSRIARETFELQIEKKEELVQI